jgi:curved DNA-binding protein CbpA
VTDLYAVLGVSRDADRPTIRRAYWKLARRAHPDAGGSPEAFALIKTAHDVLTDEARRRRYDDTGEAGELTVDARRAQLIEMLSVGLDLAMLKLSQRNQPPKCLDMVSLTGDALRERRREWDDQRREFERAAERSRELLGRFEAASGDRLMETVVEGRIAACQIQIEALSTRIKLVDDALERLHGISFRMAPEPEPSPQQQWISMLERFSRRFG